MTDKLIQTRVKEDLYDRIARYCDDNILTFAQFLREAAQHEVERQGRPVRTRFRPWRDMNRRVKSLTRRVRRIESHVGLESELEKALDELPH